MKEKMEQEELMLPSEKSALSLLNAAVAAYQANGGKRPSLKSVADTLGSGLTPLKVRKLLITAGVYESPAADKVLKLWKEGKSVEEIQTALHLSRASVHSYLPYNKTVYKLDDLPGGERSKAAEREKLYRRRKETAEKLTSLFQKPAFTENLEREVWEAFVLFQGYPFQTSKGLKFTYKIKGNEIFFTRKEKSITRSTVDIALKKVVELNGSVKGPKKLGVFGASYLYPVFVRLGLIGREER